MLRYISYVVSVLLLLLSGISMAHANSYAGLNMYGYPLTVGAGGSGAPGVPGAGYTYIGDGLNLPEDVTSRYGVVNTGVGSQTQSPTYGCASPASSDIPLGVSFGFPSATHDSATTSFARDMDYEAALDNAFISFPGVGVGSEGLSTPAINSNQADVKYSESVRFALTTDSDTIPMCGFGYPLGLGLGYGSVGVAGAGLNTGNNGVGTPY